MIRTDLFKRALLQLLALSPFSPLGKTLGAAETETLKIAFGSCAHQDKPQPVWEAVLRETPDLFIFLGDNIYGDTDDPEMIRETYRKLAKIPGFQRLTATTPVIATWDDHDYGRNDAGREYPQKEASRALMLEFWNEPPESLRWSRPDGIYTAHTFGMDGRRVQVILLDLRWNRSSLNMVKTVTELETRDAENRGPYLPVTDPSGQLLGEAQWSWLEEQFRQPAELRIIGSSIQLLADFTGWETWINFPAERNRFFELVEANQQAPVLIISGDVHWCELSRMQRPGLRFPLLELTSSGLTETWEQISPNIHRIGEAHAVPNFGLIEIEWRSEVPRITLSVIDENSRVLINTQYPG